MNTAAMRRKIEGAVNHENATGSLASVIGNCARATGRILSDRQVDGIIRFAKEYVERVPALLEEAARASRQAGVYGQMEPILEGAAQYLLQDLDLIPDHLGLLGLLDDAYLANSLLQAVSDLHRRQKGVPLISTDVTSANQLMRVIIGDPCVSILDAAVVSSLQTPALQRAVASLHGGGPMMTWADPVWNDREIQDRVDLQMELVRGSL